MLVSVVSDIYHITYKYHIFDNIFPYYLKMLVTLYNLEETLLKEII